MAERVAPGIPDNIYDGPFLSPRPVSARELMKSIGYEGRYGAFIMGEFSQWIQGVAPVDRYGFRFMADKQLPGWRQHRERELAHCLIRIGELAREMEEGNRYDRL